ncbi:vegetative incompatibility protein HET-E-1 [Naviculisporaceae sp. PSN 640]
MRLWNTHTELFEEFLDDNSIPPYAILSHTWDGEEALLTDVKSWTNSHILITHQGYQKIVKAREVARSQDCKYIWIDTCCIDQSSSAELTEAINSMYGWYARAKVCYINPGGRPYVYKSREELDRCRWFSRGWTLQELIAPQNIIFYDADWNAIGTKKTLANKLSAITKIDRDILLHRKSLSTVSVAQKMSWAAGRKTTRTEDTAYCLLGIFGVHLPAIYGEKHRAFRRLQEAILNSESNDLSIFAWSRQPSTKLHRGNGKECKTREYCGVFATAPSDFSRAGNLAKKVSPRRVELQPGNCGIKVMMQFFIQMTPENGGYRYLLPLDCYNEDNRTAVVCVRLRKYGWNGMVRENPAKIEEITTPLLMPMTIGCRYLIPETPLHWHGTPDGGGVDFIGQSREHAIQFELGSGIWFQFLDIWPAHRFDGEDRLFYLNEKSENDACMLRLRGGVLSPSGLQRVDFEFMFCAAGWSSTLASELSEGNGSRESKLEPPLQCGVMDYREYAAAFSEFRTDAQGWDFHSEHFLERLVYHQMPKRSSIVMEVHGNGRASVGEAGSPLPKWVRVWFEADRDQDPDVCRNDFWKITFHREYSDDKESLELKCDNYGAADLGWEMIADQGPVLGSEQIGMVGRGHEVPFFCKLDSVQWAS